ncbi:MAG: hypothetical protein AAFP70_16885, partial [Calditrichota bacterium]
FKKLYITLSRDNTGIKWSLKKGYDSVGVGYTILNSLSNVWWIFIWFCALMGTWRYRDFLSNSHMGIQIFAFSLFLIVIHAVFESQPRYHMPMSAFLVIPAAMCLNDFFLPNTERK